jgi:hypothetical protein
MIFNKFNLSSLKNTNFIFLKKKNFLSKYYNIYGQNYVVLDESKNVNLLKQNISKYNNTTITCVNYNYNNIFNFNQFMIALVLNNIK